MSDGEEQNMSDLSDDEDYYVLEEEDESAPPISSHFRLSETMDRSNMIIHIIPASRRLTSNVLNEQEKTEAIGLRATQIENASQPFTDVSGLSDPVEIARKEFYDRCSPLILCRDLRRTPTECWREEWLVREMIFPITD